MDNCREPTTTAAYYVTIDLAGFDDFKDVVTDLQSIAATQRLRR